MASDPILRIGRERDPTSTRVDESPALQVGAETVKMPSRLTLGIECPRRDSFAGGRIAVANLPAAGTEAYGCSRTVVCPRSSSCVAKTAGGGRRRSGAHRPDRGRRKADAEP